jgi:hypothetical protein
VVAIAVKGAIGSVDVVAVVVAIVVAVVVVVVVVKFLTVS